MGGPSYKPGHFVPPQIKGRWPVKLAASAAWFFIFFRIYHDGPHHFLNHHPWERPDLIAHLDKVDEKRQFITNFAQFIFVISENTNPSDAKHFLFHILKVKLISILIRCLDAIRIQIRRHKSSESLFSMSYITTMEQHPVQMITESVIEDIEHAVDVVLCNLRPSFRYSLSTLISKIKDWSNHNPSEIEAWSRSVIDIAEQNYKNRSYKSITLLDRSFYSISALLHAIVLLKNSNPVDRLDAPICAEIIAILDKASILTGCPILPKFHASFAKRIQDYVNLQTINSENQIYITVSLQKQIPANLSNPVAIVREIPSMSEMASLLAQGTPVLFKNFNSHWPAISDPDRCWSHLSRLVSIIGSHRLVPVEIGTSYLDDKWSQKLMPFGEFVQNIQGSNDITENERLYLAQYDLLSAFPKLMDDISLPEVIHQMTSSAVQKINAWIGPANTVSPAHHDPYENLFAQVVGVKYLKLFAPNDPLYPFPADSLLSNTSQVNVESPDHDAFPSYKDANGIEVEVFPGDMLYIPKGWWHFVKAKTPSVSISFWY